MCVGGGGCVCGCVCVVCMVTGLNPQFRKQDIRLNKL